VQTPDYTLPTTLSANGELIKFLPIIAKHTHKHEHAFERGEAMSSLVFAMNERARARAIKARK
jgi:hypothetical protein